MKLARPSFAPASGCEMLDALYEEGWVAYSGGVAFCDLAPGPHAAARALRRGWIWAQVSRGEAKPVMAPANWAGEVAA